MQVRDVPDRPGLVIADQMVPAVGDFAEQAVVAPTRPRRLGDVRVGERIDDVTEFIRHVTRRLDDTFEPLRVVDRQPEFHRRPMHPIGTRIIRHINVTHAGVLPRFENEPSHAEPDV